MKNIFAIVIVAMIFNSSYSQTKQDYYEAKICECFQTSYDSIDIDFVKDMYDFQQYLIDQGLLKDSTGLSYLNVFRKIYKEDHLNFNNSFQLNEFENSKLTFTRCLNSQRNYTPKDTKIYTLYLMLDSIAIETDLDNFTPKFFCEKLFRILNEKDLDKPVYKYFALTSLYLLSVPKYKDKYSLKISIDSTNTVYCDSSAIQLDDLDYLITNKMRTLTDMEKDKFFIQLEISPSARMSILVGLKMKLRKNNIRRINYRTKE
jgi:hypothetical protein